MTIRMSWSIRAAGLLALALLATSGCGSSSGPEAASAGAGGEPSGAPGEAVLSEQTSAERRGPGWMVWRLSKAVERHRWGVARRLASPEVLGQLRYQRRNGARDLTPRGCFTPDDPELGSRLGDAPRGCLLDLADGPRNVVMVLRVYPASRDRWIARSYEILPAG